MAEKASQNKTGKESKKLVGKNDKPEQEEQASLSQDGLANGVINTPWDFK